MSSLSKSELQARRWRNVMSPERNFDDSDDGDRSDSDEFMSFATGTTDEWRRQTEELYGVGEPQRSTRVDPRKQDARRRSQQNISPARERDVTGHDPRYSPPRQSSRPSSTVDKMQTPSISSRTPTTRETTPSTLSTRGTGSINTYSSGTAAAEMWGRDRQAESEKEYDTSEPVLVRRGATRKVIPAGLKAIAKLRPWRTENANDDQGRPSPTRSPTPLSSDGTREKRRRRKTLVPSELPVNVAARTGTSRSYTQLSLDPPTGSSRPFHETRSNIQSTLHSRRILSAAEIEPSTSTYESQSSLGARSSKRTTTHSRKTMRHSQTELSVTRESPKPQYSDDDLSDDDWFERMTPQEYLRAFLARDLIEQRQKGLMQHTGKVELSFEEEKERKRKTKHGEVWRSTLEGDDKQSFLSHADSTDYPNRRAVPSTTESRRSLLAQKQASMSTIETRSTQPSSSFDGSVCPTLHSVFEWSRSASKKDGGDPATCRRSSLERVPSSRGVMDRRMLMQKAYSTSDISQYHVTPTWPSAKPNARLHSRFYDISMRRRFDRESKYRTGSPAISAEQMLRIMEPCSRREIMAAQGRELKAPRCRDECMLNYGVVLDTIEHH